MTDWYMFGATMCGSIATIATIYYTNKRYEKDKAYQNKKDNLVIIKPNLRFCCLANIINELIIHNVRDRVLIISSEKDGFDFYDNNKRLNENHRFFSIKNESENNIRFLKIDVSSKLKTKFKLKTKSELKTKSDLTLKDDYSNLINILRSKEEVIFRIHNTEQRNKLWDELNNHHPVKSLFSCKINYITNAEEQIYYQYEVEIEHIPGEKTENGVIDNAGISVIKDEYKILSEITLKTNEKASIFRNMQDKISTLDKLQYINERMASAQFQGVMNKISSCGFAPLFFGNQQVSLNKELQKSEATDIPTPPES